MRPVERSRQRCYVKGVFTQLPFGEQVQEHRTWRRLIARGWPTEEKIPWLTLSRSVQTVTDAFAMVRKAVRRSASRPANGIEPPTRR